MNRLKYLTVSFLILALDSATKWLVSANIGLNDAVPLVPNFFQLVHVRNTGAAFGIGANAESHLVPILLNVGALAVFAVVVVYSFRSAVTDRTLQVGLHLILGGAIGNLVDRFRLSYVVDFLDVYVNWGGQAHHWPAFNVADSAICIGIGLLFLDMRREPVRAQTTA
ncbi:MAG TPA: signal peptidase II [Thermoanaerobaculia bacterium]|nr:signal peptidase II [Thermoanaerobaculia bacterium]